MSELILLVGPVGSGKSTYAKELEERTYKRINQDDLGREGHMNEFTNALMANRNIVLDRMNFSKEQRERYLKPAKQLGYTTKIVVFHVPHAVCMERCLARKDHPTVKTKEDASKALHFFFKKYERVENNESDVVERLGWDGAKEDAICVDLDGTLCNIDHRLHFVKADKPDWRNFFYNIPYDEVNGWCTNLIYRMADRYPIVLASGRPDDYKKETVKWLDSNAIHFDNLFMRSRGDYRKDDIVKEIIYEWEIKTRYNVLFWVDDRQQVVDKIRSHGVTVLQCAKGDF